MTAIQADTLLPMSHDLKEREGGLSVRILMCFPILQIILTNISKITFPNKTWHTQGLKLCYRNQIKMYLLHFKEI